MYRLQRREQEIVAVPCIFPSSEFRETNIIKGGGVLPDAGQVTINGASVITNSRIARSYLGACPQFIPIDSKLTVREHLASALYGRLKGLRPGPKLKNSI